VLAGSAALGVALVVALGGLGGERVGALEGVDGGVDEASSDAGTPTVGTPHARDAGAPAAPPDAGLSAPDAGLSAPDAGASSATRDAGIAGMSRLEREDAAKDAIDRARAQLERGRLDDAARELAQARALDPDSSDLEELEERLGALRAGGEAAAPTLP
jgi:hypothetical protein